MDPVSTARCVVDAQRGDALARERLAGHWAPLTLAWCQRMGGPTIEAEDAAHDALLVALSRLSGLRDPQRADAWMYGIVRRTLAWHRRKAWWRRLLPWTDADDVGTSANPSAQAGHDEASARVRALLEQLPAPQREVLVLCVVEERTVTEVAELLGVPVGTVKSRLRLARERCRSLGDVSDLDELVPEVSTW